MLPVSVFLELQVMALIITGDVRRVLQGIPQEDVYRDAPMVAHLHAMTVQEVVLSVDYALIVHNHLAVVAILLAPSAD